MDIGASANLEVVYVAEVLVVIQYNVLFLTSGYTRSVAAYRVACTK